MLRRLYDLAYLFKEYLVVMLLLSISIALLTLNDNPQIRTIRSLAIVSVGLLQDAVGFVPNYFDLRRENKILRELNLTLAAAAPTAATSAAGWDDVCNGQCDRQEPPASPQYRDT